MNWGHAQLSRRSASDHWQSGRRERKIASGVMAVMLYASSCHANCVSEDRSLKDFPGGADRVEGVVCKLNAAPNSPSLRIERYRLSEAAAAALVSPGDGSRFLGPLLGSKLQENRLSELYRDLVKKFGISVKVSGDISAFLEIGKRSRSDEEFPPALPGASGKVLKTIYGQTYAQLDYPAADEIQSLSRKSIPNELQFFYRVTCDEKDPASGNCKEYDIKSAKPVFWRSMTSIDVNDYSRRVERINNALRKAKKVEGTFSSLSPPRGLRMVDYLADGNWPEQLVVMIGEQHTDEEGCTITGWSFSYTLPTVELELIAIENLSSKPVQIGSIQGDISRDTALRPADSQSEKRELQAAMTTVIPPKGRIVVPTRLVISSALEDEDHDTSNAVFSNLGASSFTGNTSSYRIPNNPEFVIGPVLDVKRVEANGQKLSLTEQVTNDLMLTVSSAAGSCPILLHQAPSGEWIENGKILDRARGEKNEMAHSVSFPGLANTFRLEEREPEVVYIRGAMLTLRTENGATVDIVSDRIANKREATSLLWNDWVQLDFPLPPSIAPDSIIESTLTVSGYYVRYSDMRALSFTIERASTEVRSSR